MSKLNNRPPKYSKMNRYAVVYVNGKPRYLGLYGSPESKTAYARFIAEIQASPALPPQNEGGYTSIPELTAAYLDYAEASINPTDSGETMLNACIIAEWFVNEAKRIFATLSPKDDESAANGLPADGLTDSQRAVLRVLRGKSKPMIRSKIHGASSATKKMTADDVEQALNELVRLGKLKRRWRKGKGAKAREYKIVEKFDEF